MCTWCIFSFIIWVIAIRHYQISSSAATIDTPHLEEEEEQGGMGGDVALTVGMDEVHVCE
jgi:hypothetical protein